MVHVAACPGHTSIVRLGHICAIGTFVLPLLVYRCFLPHPSSQGTFGTMGAAQMRGLDVLVEQRMRMERGVAEVGALAMHSVWV